MRELRTSFENLALDFFKEVKHRDRSHGKRSKKKAREKKQKPTSDIDFRELKTKQNDSDTNTLDAWYHNGQLEKLKMETKLKNPFQGYLFKEDIETLRKSIEKDRNEKGPFKASALSKNMRENGDATMNNKVRSTFDDGHNDEKSKLKSIEDEALTFVKAKEEFKRQMNFTGMIYRLSKRRFRSTFKARGFVNVSQSTVIVTISVTFQRPHLLFLTFTSVTSTGYSHPKVYISLFASMVWMETQTI